MAKSHTAAIAKVSEEIGQGIADESKQKDPATLEKLTLLAKELNVLGNNVVVPLVRTIEEYDLDQKVAERAYRPDVMEKELKLHAELEKLIDKTVKRLVTIKEYKKYFGEEAIEAQSTEVVSLPAKPARNSAKE